MQVLLSIQNLVTAMDEIVYNSIVRYFSTLSNLGYISYEDVNSLLFLTAIQEFIYKDFRGFINEDDYREIEKALYKVFGTSCLVPYPEYCNNANMNKLHSGDISELAHRVENIEEIQDIKVVEEIQDIKVVKVLAPYEEEVEDIVPAP